MNVTGCPCPLGRDACPACLACFLATPVVWRGPRRAAAAPAAVPEPCDNRGLRKQENNKNRYR